MQPRRNACLACCAAAPALRAAAKLPTVRRLRDAIYSPEFRDFISSITGQPHSRAGPALIRGAVLVQHFRIFGCLQAAHTRKPAASCKPLEIGRPSAMPAGSDAFAAPAALRAMLPCLLHFRSAAA